MTFSRWTSTTRCVPCRPSPLRSPALMAKSPVNNRKIPICLLTPKPVWNTPVFTSRTTCVFGLRLQCFLWWAPITSDGSLNVTMPVAALSPLWACDSLQDWERKLVSYYHLILHGTLQESPGFCLDHRQTHISSKDSIEWRVMGFFDSSMMKVSYTNIIKRCLIVLCFGFVVLYCIVLLCIWLYLPIGC